MLASVLITGLDTPLGLQEVKAPRIPRNRLICTSTNTQFPGLFIYIFPTSWFLTLRYWRH